MPYTSTSRLEYHHYKIVTQIRVKGHTKANTARAKVACGTSSHSKDLGAARAGEGAEKVRGRKETGFLKIVFLLFFSLY